jgi:hypothetical protein
MLNFTKNLLKTRTSTEVYTILIGGGIASLEACELITKALAPQKIQMKELVIVWSEGLIDEDIHFTSWQAFNNTLAEIAKENDKDGYTGCYAKTKFQLVWEDGTIYTGRLDVNTKEDNNVGQHMLEFLNFQSGKACPAHFTQNEYESLLTEQDKQDATEYLNTYNIVI